MTGDPFNDWLDSGEPDADPAAFRRIPPRELWDLAYERLVTKERLAILERFGDRDTKDLVAEIRRLQALLKEEGA